MSPFRVLFWRFAWSSWDDVAYQTEFHGRGHVLAATYRRLFLGLWFATVWNVPALRRAALRDEESETPGSER